MNMSSSFQLQDVKWFLWKWNTPFHMTWDEYLLLPHLSKLGRVLKNRTENNKKISQIRKYLQSINLNVSLLTGLETFEDGSTFQSFLTTCFFRRPIRFVPTEDHRIPPLPKWFKETSMAGAKAEDLSVLSVEEQDQAWKDLVVKARSACQELIFMSTQSHTHTHTHTTEKVESGSGSNAVQVRVERFIPEQQTCVVEMVQVSRKKKNETKVFKKQSNEMYHPVLSGCTLTDIRTNNYIIQFARGSIDFDSILPNGVRVGCYITQYMVQTLRLTIKCKKMLYQDLKRQTRLVSVSVEGS